MKPKFRLFRRAGIYWVHDSETGRQQSLRTKKRGEAVRLLHGRNEAHAVPFANLQMARAYMMAADPAAGTRTWKHVIDEIIKEPTGGAHRDPAQAIASLGKAIGTALDRLGKLDKVRLRAARWDKYLKMGG